MSFFQNLFPADFEGSWLLGDRQHIPKFVVKSNAGRGNENVVSWHAGPYNLSGSDADGDTSALLKIAFSLRGDKNWGTISINVATGAVSSSAVTVTEIAHNLNNDATFAERFVATVGSYNNEANPAIQIKQKKPATEFRFYILNGQAEEKIGFNARAGVAELPTYFERHTIENRFTFDDSQGMLIELDPVASDVQADIIDDAVDAKGVNLGYDSSTVMDDYQLLLGKSGLFQFQKGPGSGPVTVTTTTIVYPAGAATGDLSKKTVTQYNSGTQVVAIYELPYTLLSGDIITPP